MISLELSEDEVVEVVNSTVLTAFHALEDDDDEAWRVISLTVAIADKLEAVFPALIESERLLCARELLVLRRRLASR